MVMADVFSPDAYALFARTDSLPHLIAALIAGFCVGFFFLGSRTATAPFASAFFTFMITMSVQLAEAAANIVTSTTTVPATIAYGPLFWLPLWFFVSGALYLGIRLHRHEHPPVLEYPPIPYDPPSSV